MGAKNGRNTRALSNVWTDISPLVAWGKEKVKHPTQKPLQICNRILDVFGNLDAGNLVLDCYAGSGTTLKSAKDKGFQFIGIEKDPCFYEIIKDRLTNS